MGAASSKDDQQGEGIVTVVPAAATQSRIPSTLPSESLPGSRSHSRLSNRLEQPEDPLLSHLADLKAQGAKLDLTNLTNVTHISSGRKGSAAGAGTAADPESLLADLSAAQHISNDTRSLNAAISTLVTSYQAWHTEQIRALTHNQEYITRTIDQAEVKSEKAVRHVQQQTIKLKQVATGLAKAEHLPAIVQQLTAATEALELQLQHLEQQANMAAGPAAFTAQRQRPLGQQASSLRLSNTSSSHSPQGSFTGWLGVGSGRCSQQQQQAQEPPEVAATVPKHPPAPAQTDATQQAVPGECQQKDQQ